MEMKPCPFCGGEARLVSVWQGSYGFVYGIMCFEGCSALSAYCKEKQEAIERWNRRVQP